MSLDDSDGLMVAGLGSAPDRNEIDPILRHSPASETEERAEERLSEILMQIRDDLGYQTASLFVRGPDGWRLLERQGPVRSWHGVLDPSVFEGTPEAAEYRDSRAIPGVGPRLAGLGCSSVATLSLPDGGRVLFDSEHAVRTDGWIERARPYLELISIMAGPAWPVGGSLGGHEEVASLDRLFTACQAVLKDTSTTVENLLEEAREAIRADELFLIGSRGGGMEVVASPAGSWPRRLPHDEDVAAGGGSIPGLDEAIAHRLARALGATSRALGGAFGRGADEPELLLAGWTEGPALSPVTMTVAAQAVSIARAALQGRRHAVDIMVDRERSRMAYALHDGLTQTVAGAVLELEALAKRIERDPAEALSRLESSKMEIRRSLAELRGMLFDLSRPPDDEGATEPLISYIEDVVKRWRLPARVAVDGDLSHLPPRVLTVAYIVIREALANAAKHAAGQNVTISLTANDDDLVVVIGDGGRGFTRQDELDAREANHIGLDMLRHRVGEVGGTLRVESHPGNGTRVIAQLPIHEDVS